MSEQLRVMISSTARDLPEHRQKVMDACMRLGMFYPDMMEHLTATNANALEVSLKIADRADLYVGVFAFRYGYVPDGQTISVTESEYNRAVERKIPRLIFLMSDQHDIKAGDVETGAGAEALIKLKERLKKERVVGLFNTADDLKAQVIQALVPYRESDVSTFHYVSNIPEPPEEYIAHPYTLLQTHSLIGRKAELKLLTDWITGQELEAEDGKAAGDSIRIMSVIAIGGMGKSALTWKWFNEVAPEEMKPLTGRMWWSFYESDATFENFVTRALAYVTQRPIDEVKQVPAPEREEHLLASLSQEPFILVLDGLERILIAYARMDASHLDDREVGKEKGLRKTADPRAGSFLKKLARINRSRVLVSSRLYPTELETDTGDPAPGNFRLRIEGLTDEDAVELWRAFGITGSRYELLPVLATFGKHPLLIQALAGVVKRYRPAPGDFIKWRAANPTFDPSKFSDLREAMGHVMQFSLFGLNDKSQKVLQTIAAFRMPTGYDTLADVLVGEKKVCVSESELDWVLNELEDCGLVGWDKRANRYDLHPIVRSVVWSVLDDDTRHRVYSGLHSHFEALPKVDGPLNVRSLEDLTPTIELYNTLIGLGRYDEAGTLFYEQLENPTLYRLRASRQRVELLELLLNRDAPNQLPRLSSQIHQGYTLVALAQGYCFGGQPAKAVPLLSRANTIYSELSRYGSLNVGLRNLSHALRLSGALRESEASARRALITASGQDYGEQAMCLNWLGVILAARGSANESEAFLQRSLQIFVMASDSQGEGVISCFLADRALWLGEFGIALSFADRAWGKAQVWNNQGDLIFAARRQGEASLGLNDLVTAYERLHHALTQARSVNLVEEELYSLVALAELRRRQNDLTAARGFINDVWDSAERGPYPLILSDACNVLAYIERDSGNNAAAIAAANKAYRVAWCDGPPFAYHWGLEKAKQHLRELGVPDPEMPPFDQTRFEPMPEVEIDPDDQFHEGVAGSDPT